MGPHPESARRDAEVLLLHALDKDRAWLLAHSGDEVAEDKAALYIKLLVHRLKGEPMQYLAGQTEFYGLPFRVNPAVLVPRPETEHLVEKVIELATSFHAPRIVDVGTGSGCIAVTLAHYLPHARITAIDLSSKALASASESAALNKVSNRIRFLQGDLLTPVAGEQFELIISNPPYVPIADRDSLSVEVREYEPALALFAGDDGLEVYRRLIPAAFDALTSSGFVALEIGYGQSPAITEMLARAGFEQTEFVPDLQKIPRVACARRP
jgi:release factor glutamine methyltransferase